MLVNVEFNNNLLLLMMVNKLYAFLSSFHLIIKLLKLSLPPVVFEHIALFLRISSECLQLLLVCQLYTLFQNDIHKEILRYN